MKKIAFIMAVIMALTLCFAGCTQPAPAEPEPQDDGPVEEAPAAAGGWTLSENIGENITDEEREIFNKALEGLTGVGYSPIAVLGTQVVAGMNYAFLCTATPVVPNPVKKLAVISVYKDLDGNATINEIKDFSLADYTHKDIALTPEQLAGGWRTNAEVPVKELEGNVKDAFDKAVGGLMGKTYEPIEVLGTQVVAGTNYAILCKTTLVTAEPVTAISVVTVYADLSGGASLVSVADISIPEII